MKIEVKIDHTCKEPKVIILTNQMTDEVHTVLKKLSEETTSLLAGFRDEMLTLLEPPTLISVYAASGKVYAVTDQGEYQLRLRLYELESRLDHASFVRISNSEIVNLKKVRSFDLRFSGTICVTLSNGTVTYVSRRYVSKVKQVLGI